MIELVKHKRIEGDQRVLVGRQVVGMYLDGMTVRRIAVTLGRSYGFVHRLLAESGIEFRPRGGDRRGKTARSTTDAAAGSA